MGNKLNEKAVRTKYPDAKCFYRKVQRALGNAQPVTVAHYEVLESSEPNAKRLGIGLTEHDAWIVAAAAVRAEYQT